MLRAFARGNPPRTNQSSNELLLAADGASQCRFVVEDGHHYVYETHKFSSALARGGRYGAKSSPPLHIHPYQSEHFTVLKGRIGFVLEGKEMSRGAGESVDIPARARHTFFPMEEGEECQLKVRVDPEDAVSGLNEAFMRNLNSYLHDCYKVNMEPSPFQMMLFFYRHQVLIDMPLPISLIWAVHFVLGVVVGKYLLGYQESYPEYYADHDKYMQALKTGSRKKEL